MATERASLRSFALVFEVMWPASLRAKPVLGLIAGFIAAWGNLYGSATGATAAVTKPPSLTATASPTRLTTANRPCGWVVQAPTYNHIVWIFFENHSYSTIIGASDAAYFNFLAAKCGLATNYHNVTHPEPAELHFSHVWSRPGRPKPLHRGL